MANNNNNSNARHNPTSQEGAGRGGERRPQTSAKEPPKVAEKPQRPHHSNPHHPPHPISDSGDDGATESKKTLLDATKKTPVVICLEEGYRGAEEDLSMSAGDTLVLEGVTQIRGRDMVMGYYMNEILDNEEMLEIEEDGEVVYKAFVLLPCDSLPDLDVNVLGDSTSPTYHSLLGRHFSDRTWAQHRDELLDEMGDNSYINVSTIITNNPRRPKPPSSSSSSTTSTTSTTTTTHKEQWNIGGARRPPPPPPQLPPSPSTTTSTASYEGCGEGGGASSTPPPRPPRRSQHSASDEAPSTIHADQPPPRPPKMPPRPAHRGVVESQNEEEEEEEGEVFAMPSLAELFASGQFKSEGNLYDREDLSEEYLEPVALPERQAKDKKNESTLKKVKSFGKKLYGGFSKTSSSKPSTSSQSSQEEGGMDSRTSITTSPKTASVGEGADESSDEEEYYSMIDESMMDTVSKSPQARKTKPNSGTKADKGKAAESKAGSKATTSAAVKPTVRVQPRDGGGRPLMMSPPTASTHTPAPTPAQPDPVKSVTSPLKDMTCAQLCFRFQQCGMTGLAQVCRGNAIDGNFFCNLSDEELKKPPFALNSFDVDTKLKMVKAGWVPKGTRHV